VIIALSITLFFLILRFTVTLFNYISNPKLTRVSKQFTDKVSILIPARNEEKNILNLLQSIAKQDYKNYEVIIYDDCSTDGTYQLCANFASKHQAFSVVKGEPLPNGWTGKNHACAQLAKQATGKYFLFLDADTSIFNGLINSAVQRAQYYKLVLLSIFPDQEMETIGEKTTVPLLHYLLLNLLPLRLVYLSKSSLFAVACGQLMFFDAAIYRKKQWHQLVKSKVVEDAEIMKAIKIDNYKGEVLLANQMVKCRMYRDYFEALNGFSKSALALLNYSITAMLVFVTILFSGPLLVITTLNLSLIFYMLGLIMLSRIMVSLQTNQNALHNIVLHPLQMVNFIIIAFLAIQRHLTKTNYWKGRPLSE
jgi:chlorobactene glucosyltransferase